MFGTNQQIILNLLENSHLIFLKKLIIEKKLKG